MIALTRRQALLATAAAAAAAAAPLVPARAFAAETPARLDLRLASTTVPLARPDLPAEVLTYGGTIPGRVLRLRQNVPCEIVVENGLDAPTTVHCHGLRLPNAEDGVPHLTQVPIAPGGRHVYRFTPRDAGTFWYHPHLDAARQLGSGLAGALVVEEAVPVAADRDLLWMLQDWRLDGRGRIDPSFGVPMDRAHAGRWGNLVTVAGAADLAEPVKAGERVRLRLVNAASARIFDLGLDGGTAWLMALDGMPLAEPRPFGPSLVLSPGERADLFVDVTGPVTLTDAMEGERRPLARLVPGGRTAGLAGSGTPTPLPANPVPVPDLAAASRHRFVFSGGAMGTMDGAVVDGAYLGWRDMARRGLFWAVNGAVPMIGEGDHPGAPLVTLARGESTVFRLENRTRWPHPIHLHGHSFHVVRRNDQAVAAPPVKDTVLLWPDESAEVAFVADNPGDWMFHCHVLDHQEAGMMGYVRVA